MKSLKKFISIIIFGNSFTMLNWQGGKLLEET